MRKLKNISYILFIIGLLCLYGSKSDIKFKENPPGTIFIKDSLYVDIQPVRVRDYIEFMNAVKHYWTPEFKDSLNKLPDWGVEASTFKQLIAYFPNDSFYYQQMIPRTLMTHGNDKKSWDMDYHITNPIYLDFPVVNITYEQAKEFCVWRTSMVKFGYSIRCKTEKQRKKLPMNFVYRLATRKEWQFILGGVYSQIKTSRLKKDPNRPANLVSQYEIGNKNKFYYESDNVAELLDNAIITSDFMWVGGIGNISFMRYEMPKDWLGFRCVCQILVEKQTNQPNVQLANRNNRN